MVDRAAAAHTPTAALIEKERQVLELRRAGASFEEIATRVGYRNRAAAHKAYRRAISRVLKEPAEDVRDLELDRLDRLLMGVWAKASRGELGAVDRALRIGERRARLLGLDFADGMLERQVRIAEQQGELLAGGLTWLLAELGLAADEAARLAVGRMLDALAEGKKPTAIVGEIER